MSGGQWEVERLTLKYNLSYDKQVSTASLFAFRFTSEKSLVYIYFVRLGFDD